MGDLGPVGSPVLPPALSPFTLKTSGTPEPLCCAIHKVGTSKSKVAIKRSCFIRYELIINAAKLYPFTQDVKKINLTFSDELFDIDNQLVNCHKSTVSFVFGRTNLGKMLSLSTWPRFEKLLEQCFKLLVELLSCPFLLEDFFHESLFCLRRVAVTPVQQHINFLGAEMSYRQQAYSVIVS